MEQYFFLRFELVFEPNILHRSDHCFLVMIPTIRPNLPIHLFRRFIEILFMNVPFL